MLRRSQRSVQMQFSNVNVAAVLISYMHQSGVEQTENMSDASLFFMCQVLFHAQQLQVRMC